GRPAEPAAGEARGSGRAAADPHDSRDGLHPARAVRTLSFRKRLTLFSAVGIAVVLVVGSAATYLIVRSQLRGRVDSTLRSQSGQVFVLTTKGRVTVRPGAPPSAPPTGQGLGVRVSPCKF